MWPYVDELFRDDPLIDRLGGVAVRPSALRAGFDAVVDAVFAEAELDVPDGLRLVRRAAGTAQHFSTLGLSARRDAGARPRHPGATW